MNILTLSIKQKYFDEILAGKKTHEYREIRPTNAKKYITYLCGGKEYPTDAELPEEGEVELKPIKYDAIKLRETYRLICLTFKIRKQSRKKN